MAILASVLLLLAAVTLVLGQWLQRRRRERAVTQRLQGHMSRSNRFGSLLRSLGESRFGQRSISMDNETQTLLNRVGWRKASQRSLFAASQLGLPLLALGLALLVEEVAFSDSSSPWIAPFMALAAGYLFPKRLLVILAQRRQQQVVLEVSTFIPLLRILFESGMAVEQALRVLSQEGRELLPVVSEELRLVLVRVDSGLELGEELNKVAGLLAVDEFDDICVILQQLIHQGGGAMKSLLALKQLLDDRRLTRLQEYISKMSAKMSVVMMVFLFPALLIVLAGPGFTALAKAFSTF
ncbi:type II secretion system F family protein [Pseudomonas gingeri]|uniref:Type II secretion system F family protein n=1 Tax=Pseudomonas gingeri TaxID=117681 RepID=A0A7Y7XHD6_9PSED|nr:type II secretion system F family protein [Pseudomonas gingeri]NWA25253.1 type II secretion system F family protein [Pseudomonas gingeri]NWB99914.1 type II secretion system F family protein [Pseudomonas gingeri]NWD73572.1 type II secretion system F family protein [Pseudomonas gingeri]